MNRWDFLELLTCALVLAVAFAGWLAVWCVLP